MVRGRRLRKVTKRGMLNWSHYKFRQRLLQKADLTAGCTAICATSLIRPRRVGHAATSTKSLGGRNVFKCPKCNFTADRDATAARNILMRWCTLEDIKP